MWKTEVREDGEGRIVLVDGTPVTPREDLALVETEEGIEARGHGNSWTLFRHNPALTAGEAETGSGEIRAPMPGKLLALDVKEGDTVKTGARLLVLEAMKMEHRLTAPFDGTVGLVAATAGAQVTEGALLLRLDPA
jgi:3-methylcrotonyl-CoA carboxylase alpha subunit